MLRTSWVLAAASVPARRRARHLTGHTILVAFTTFAINPAFFDKVPYDPSKDFDAVTLAVASTTVFLVNASVPAKSVMELIELVELHEGRYGWRPVLLYGVPRPDRPPRLTS